MMPGYWQRNHASRSYYHLGNTLMQKATQAIQRIIKNNENDTGVYHTKKKRRITLHAMDQEEAAILRKLAVIVSRIIKAMQASIRMVLEDSHGSIGQLKGIIKRSAQIPRSFVTHRCALMSAHSNAKQPALLANN